MKPLSLSRKLFFATITVVLTLFLILVIGEIIFRVYHKINDISTEKPEPPPPYNTANQSDKYGWYPKANYTYTGSIEDKANVWYDLNITTTQNGFRQFGNPASDLKKILFIGDSYTQSVEVSDEKTFYHLIGDSLPVEIFAFGMAGYGQMQEYMVLEAFYDSIKPDLVVLQVCTNDFIDNHHTMEENSGYRVGLKRPYLNPKDEIVYHHPLPSSEKIGKYSLFLGYINDHWDTFLKKQEFRFAAEKSILRFGTKYEPYQQSIDITERLLLKFQSKTIETELLVFSSDSFEPQFSVYHSICEKNKINWTSAPINAIYQKEKSNIVIRSRDGYHWNEKGHEVIANALIPILKPYIN